MKTLEEIFQTHFNCPEPFDKTEISQNRANLHERN